MKELMRGVRNGGPFIQGFAPSPAHTVSQAVAAGQSETVEVPAGAMACRYREVDGLSVTAKIEYTAEGGDPAIEAAGWPADEDFLVFPPDVTVTGIEFTAPGDSAATVVVRFM